MSSLIPTARENDAAALIARVGSAAAAGVARRALVLRLSRLPAALARPHHLRLARAALAPLRAADRAEAFDLPNTDTAVLWRGEGAAALRASLDAVAELFAGAAPSAPDPDALCVVFDLPQQAETLLRLARASQLQIPPDANAEAAGAPLDGAALAALEAALASADVSRFARRQPVCAALPGGEFRLAWERRVLSVGEIGAALAPGYALRADAWLFQRLARTFERRLLALLAAPEEVRAAGPFALEATVGGVLSPAFGRFDAALPSRLRGRVVLALRAADLLADLPAFLFARDFARARGYRLLLHAADPLAAETLPAARLGVDLLQLRWSATLAATCLERLGAEPAGTVLAGADTEEAVAWGRREGIALFQGWAAVPAGARRGGALTGS